MRESVLKNLQKCSKCGEYYYKYRGVNDSRCESCYEEADMPKAGESEHDKQSQT